MVEALEGILSASDFGRITGVSRETLDRLEIYSELLKKWQKTINLVGRGSFKDLWRRHMLDSAQLLAMAPQGAEVWLDMGSGAGFPGLVLAIMGAGEVHLVESDGRKCAFLVEAARLTGAEVQIHNSRIEDLWDASDVPSRIDVITARALSSTASLLEMARPFATARTICLFPKGQDVDKELTKDTIFGKIDLQKIPSTTNSESVVLRIGRLA